MSTTVEFLRERYDEQLRSRVITRAPLGAVVEQVDGATVMHYGTHSTVQHTALSATSQEEIAALVARVRSTAAARGEPAEWRVYAHDPSAAQSVQELAAAGFTPGWQRSVLIAEIDEITTPALAGVSWTVEALGYRNPRRRVQAADLAQRSGPHRVALSEWLAVGRSRGTDVQIAVLLNTGGPVAVGWAEDVRDTQFVAIGGMSAPRTELLKKWVEWTRSFSLRSRMRYMTADADGALREALLDSGFREAASVQSFHLYPPGPRETTPPISQMIDDSEDHEVWQRVTARLGFSSTPKAIRILAPQDSFTWSTGMLDRPEDPKAEAVEQTVRRGLVSCTRPGEHLYFQRHGLQGFRFDPRRVGEAGGRPGWPAWPGSVCAWDEYHFLTTADARVGTYADPNQQTLCVFGSELLDEVSGALTKLLGNDGIWSFG